MRFEESREYEGEGLDHFEVGNEVRCRWKTDFGSLMFGTNAWNLATQYFDWKLEVMRAVARHARDMHYDDFSLVAGEITDKRSIYILGEWTCTVTSNADCFLNTGIVSADKYSRAFEKSRHSEDNYQDEAERQRQEAKARKSAFQKVMDWGKENRYPIVGGSWVASMVIALGLVGRSPHLSTQQKIVQARVYAQGLTLAVLVATAAFEIGDKGKGEGRWETVQIVDPNDPTHKHLIDKKIHHERYAGEDQWRGGSFL